MRKYTRVAVAAASALTLALGTAACATDDSADATDTTTTAEAAADSGPVTFSDGWAKATDTEMSGVFGVIANPGDEDVHLTGVSAEIDGSHELHESVPGGGGMSMQEKEDGFVIPAGGELLLQPGGDHIMLMGLEDPITTGQQISVTLEFADGAEQEITVSARDFEGAEENYAGDMDHGDMDHGDMDHGEMDDDEMEHGGMDHDG